MAAARKIGLTALAISCLGLISMQASAAPSLSKRCECFSRDSSGVVFRNMSTNVVDSEFWANQNCKAAPGIAGDCSRVRCDEQEVPPGLQLRLECGVTSRASGNTYLTSVESVAPADLEKMRSKSVETVLDRLCAEEGAANHASCSVARDRNNPLFEFVSCSPSLADESAGR
jgi:hypothetical protein